MTAEAFVYDALRCVEEKVLTSVEDADMGSIMGIGFPPPAILLERAVPAGSLRAAVSG